MATTTPAEAGQSRPARSRTETRCSIARTLEVIGQRWAILVIREAFWGRTRFADFRARLGVAPDVLADRLNTLVEHGILERRRYREEGRRERDEYVLTDAGRDLLPVLGALAQWGDVHAPTGFGPAAIYTEAATGRPLSIGFVDQDGTAVDAGSVAVVRGPGAVSSEHP